MRLKLIIGLILMSFSTFSQEPITIGHTATLHSQILNEDRPLEIYLPKNYKTSKRK